METHTDVHKHMQHVYKLTNTNPQIYTNQKVEIT